MTIANIDRRLVTILAQGKYKCTEDGIIHSYTSRWGLRSTPLRLQPYQRPDGYLQVNIGNRAYLVHRVIYTFFKGAIPKGMQINHINYIRDDNRIENLEVVTQQENIAIMVRAGRASRGEHQRKAVINPRIVKAIRSSKEQFDFSNKELALLFGVSHVVIWGVLSGTNWSHIK